MSKKDFIPSPDHDFMVWLDHLATELSLAPADYGVTGDEVERLQSMNTGFKTRISSISSAQAAVKEMIAYKNAERDTDEAWIRLLARRIKAQANYSEGKGAHLGIIGSENTFDLATAKPDLVAIDLTGGQVQLSYTKRNSDGINIYSKRGTDIDWVFLARVNFSPYIDNRLLLQTGIPELRYYTAVYVLKDQEIGGFSNDISISCAP